MLNASKLHCNEFPVFAPSFCSLHQHDTQVFNVVPCSTYLLVPESAGLSALQAFSFHSHTEGHVLKSKRALLKCHPGKAMRQDRSGATSFAMAAFRRSGPSKCPQQSLSSVLSESEGPRKGIQPSLLPALWPGCCTAHVWRQIPGKGLSSPACHSHWATQLFEAKLV